MTSRIRYQRHQKKRKFRICIGWIINLTLLLIISEKARNVQILPQHSRHLQKVRKMDQKEVTCTLLRNPH